MAGMEIEHPCSAERAAKILDELYDECCATGTKAQVRERCRAIMELKVKLTGEPDTKQCTHV